LMVICCLRSDGGNQTILVFGSAPIEIRKVLFTSLNVV
jgi:hypothetical protein